VISNATKHGPSPQGTNPARGQRGFALLLVLAMAAAGAIYLYMQLPRVAFEAQRDRESMLIQRGKEYRRGIELYVRKNNKYPERLEDLERQQDLRFLRRRYKDPMTGKDEWRIIRITASGQLEGSLIKKATAKGTTPGMGGANTGDAKLDELLGNDEGVAENSALARQRSGDQMAANAAFPGAGAGTRASNDPNDLNQNANRLDEGLVPILDASGNVVERAMTQEQAAARQRGTQPNAAAGDASQQNTDEQDPNNPSSGEQANSKQPRLGPGGIPIIENPAEVVAQTGKPGQQQGPGNGSGGPGPSSNPNLPGNTPTGANNQPTNGTDAINRILTSPVPGGLAAIQQRRSGTGQSGRSSFGAGIAGVASKREMRGILVFDEQESIHKWEFVFDATKQKSNSQNNSQRGQGYTGGASGTPSNNSGRTGR